MPKATVESAVLPCNSMSDRVGGSSIRAEQGLQLLLAQRRGIDPGRCLLEHGAAAAQLANGAARIDGTAASKRTTSYYSTFTEEEERKGWKGRGKTRKEMSEGRSCPARRPVARNESQEFVNSAPDVR